MVVVDCIIRERVNHLGHYLSDDDLQGHQGVCVCACACACVCGGVWLSPSGQWKMSTSEGGVLDLKLL